MGRRLALLITTHEHEDPALRRLTAPAADVEALAAVLRDPVTVLINEPHYRVGEAVAELYRARRRDDLTFLYFTGHGLKDEPRRHPQRRPPDRDRRCHADHHPQHVL